MQVTLSTTRQKNNTASLTRSPLVVVIYISLCAFVIYTCMYGFRKPYTAATYSNSSFMGISYKVCLVIAQVLGYMCSKFYGIRFIAEMQPTRRAAYILYCIGIAWASLLLFAIIPAPYNIVCLFINGLPLGMVFGLVFGYLEGRQTTEILGAVLATSFIFASGLAKTVGKWLLLDWQISETWMPFTAGAIFAVPLIVAVYLLHRSPGPTEQDIALRSIRKPMSRDERKQFLKTFGASLIPIVLSYAIFTIVRDFCEDFSNELWIETGYQNNAGIFTRLNTIISLIVLVVMGAFVIVKNNYRAFKGSHYLVLAGLAFSATATLCFNIHLLPTFAWMLIATTGLYLAYLPFNCLYFERMIATYKINGNFGFVMYIADAFGYLGTVTVLLIKEFMPVKYSWTAFFTFLFYTSAILGVLLIATSLNIHSKLFKKIWNKNQPS
ncbi:DUF5690 family protein [Ferruginibacter sp.]